MKKFTTLSLLGTAIGGVLGGSNRTQDYDYVIVGGGVTGLVVANRLTEDAHVSVLVIESGESIDNDQTMIPYKANEFAGSAPLMWNGITSRPEPGLGNATFSVSVAKVLGGGSVINGMVYDRGSAADYDAWEALGNKGWGWEGVFPYFKKGTTFQPPSPAVAESFNITWDSEVYGDGPLALSITDTQFADINDWWCAWKATGIHVPVDGNNGEAYGSSWYPNTMDKKTGRRAHARYAYIDPIAERTNLKIITATTAEKIIFGDKQHPSRATGVQILDNASNDTCTITAKKEVVLAAGAVQTPKLLQLSGIGPRSVLEAAGIDVLVELDAVGSNYQDHPWATVMLNSSTTTFPTLSSLTTNTTYNASAWTEYQTSKTGPYTYARGNALAFISLPDMTPNITDILSILSNQTDPEPYLPAIYSASPSLLAGFNYQKNIISALLSSPSAAAAEFPVPADSGSFGLVAIEKPLSRGTIHLNAQNPSGPPDITHNAFVNPVDRAILGTALRFIRTLWSSPYLTRFEITESVPGAQCISDEEIFAALLAQKALSPTLAHSSGSCPMMPEALGGCVSEELRVYGTERLSVVDASIIPMIPSQHLQATAYMIGEKAADLIKARA